MDNRPHSRNKKIVDKKIKVEKKPLVSSRKKTNILKGVFNTLVKK